MPFVTEEIWQHLTDGISAEERAAPALIIAPWPVPSESMTQKVDATAEEQFALLQEIITRIRDARKQAGVEPGKIVEVILAGGTKAVLLKQQAALIQQLARTGSPRIERRLSVKPSQAMGLVAGGVEVYLPLAGMLDIEKELIRLDAQIEAARSSIERSKSKLENPNFVARARPDIVAKEQEALAAAEDTLAKLTRRRQELVE
jgi:valyl-tRNA synthetase